MSTATRLPHTRALGARTDLRLTVDYPEDLVVCRVVYEALTNRAPCFPFAEIVQLLDRRSDLKALVTPYVDERPVWHGYPQGISGKNAS